MRQHLDFIRVVPAFLQDRREGLTATVTSSMTASRSFFYRRRARRHKGVIDLAQAPRNHQRIAGDPTRLVRRQEHRDRRYIFRLSGPPKRVRATNCFS
jgi:uncharacterized protein with von Willebrand factor type A (vWA) domain